jgi:hypothetical protein
MVINPETGVLAHCKEDKTFESHSVDWNQKHVLEKFLTPEEIALCDNRAVEIHRKNQEKRRYEAARKVPESEWNAPVFDEDNYYYTLDDLYDYYACEYSDDPEDEDYWKNTLPDYVFGCEEIQSLKYDDLKWAVDNVFEKNLQMLEDADEYYNPIPDYLQEAWNRFVDENSRPFYEIDHKTVILLDKN